jgi:hypothetical protein
LAIYFIIFRVVAGILFFQSFCNLPYILFKSVYSSFDLRSPQFESFRVFRRDIPIRAGEVMEYTMRVVRQLLGCIYVVYVSRERIDKALFKMNL